MGNELKEPLDFGEIRQRLVDDFHNKVQTQNTSDITMRLVYFSMFDPLELEILYRLNE